MKTYLVSYDLIKSDSTIEYSRLINGIKSYKYWAKPLESLWLIKTDATRLQIMTYLKTFIDTNDHLLVIEITNNWIAYNLSRAVIDWMKGIQ